MKNFTVEETNLMCCFNPSSRKRLIDDMKGVTLNDMDGETFKELKAADYIPIGATLNVDGIKCRIDAVDFAADEVRLTNIEDKNRPIRFSESIQYVRAYVEDAGTAIYDTVPKKPAARESIRDKLKSAQKAQPPHTPKPQKLKGKDMVL